MLYGEEDSRQTDVEHGAPAVNRMIDDWTESSYPCRVDCDIDATEGIDGNLYETFEVWLLCHIHSCCDASVGTNGCRDFIEPATILIADHELSTFFGEPLGCAPTDS